MNLKVSNWFVAQLLLQGHNKERGHVTHLTAK